MREILFKAKRLDNGEWVQGYPFQAWERAYILWGTTNDVPNMVEVDPATVCQYTGLTDKNRKRIFEGDIVKWGHVPGYEEHPIRVSIVQIDPDIQFDAGFKLFHYGAFAYAGETDKALEVIGSIHDTPCQTGEEAPHDHQHKALLRHLPPLRALLGRVLQRRQPQQGGHHGRGRRVRGVGERRGVIP